MKDLKRLLNEWRRLLFAIKKQVQSLVEKLNVVAEYVRLFISRMLEFMSFMPENRQVLLSEEFQLDVK